MHSALRIEDCRWLYQQTRDYVVKPKRPKSWALSELLRPGTGGMLTLQSFLEPQDFRFPIGNKILVRARKGFRARSQTDELAEIRASLKPTVLELARLFGVSRQAIYDWQAGKSMSRINADRLAALANAARMLRAEGIVVSPQLMRRKIIKGMPLLEAIRSGEDADEAVRTLVRLASSEAQQRETLQRRITGRPALELAGADFGTPHLDEGG